jgi:hypothetical protein
MGGFQLRIATTEDEMVMLCDLQARYKDHPNPQEIIAALIRSATATDYAPGMPRTALYQRFRLRTRDAHVHQTRSSQIKTLELTASTEADTTAVAQASMADHWESLFSSAPSASGGRKAGKGKKDVADNTNATGDSKDVKDGLASLSEGVRCCAPMQYVKSALALLRFDPARFSSALVGSQKSLQKQCAQTIYWPGSGVPTRARSPT